MQATSLTGAGATVAIVLGVIGLYLDSLAAVAGALGLAGLLCGQGVIFAYRTARFADELQIERAVESRPVYLGAVVEVEVRATTTTVPSLQARLTDLPPRSAIYDHDEAVLHDGEGRYRVRFMTPGEVSYQGVLLETANRFFRTTIHHAASSDAEEKMVVLPADNGGSPSVQDVMAGARELARAGLPQGMGVRGFRPFHQGDDPARIDWKLTAKYNRPFVREPMSEAGSAPLVVVDLPTDHEDSAAVAVLQAASAEIRREIREHGRCTLLLIAGGEVIAYRQHERDLVGLLRLLSIQPPGPLHPLYRVRDPATLMETLRLAERELSIPSQRLAVTLRTALGTGVRSSFEREINRVLSAAEHREVLVYTVAPADVSHLNLIAAAARRRRRRLVIRLPRATKGSLPWLSRYPRVEAI